jgi:putative ABC transport system permease protein
LENPTRRRAKRNPLIMKTSTVVTLWLKGLISNRSGRLITAALGVTLTVAMLAALGVFIASSAAAMTKRATESIPVDWQVQLVPGTDPAFVIQAAQKAAPVQQIEQVSYADVSSLKATTGGTVQTTGAGKVVGISPDYARQFPDEFRSLAGTMEGVLVAQQTAANLHVTAGDTVTIERIGLPPVDVIISGVIDLPYADSFFQAVGLPANAAPQAPPDNVLFLPADQWHNLFDPQSAIRPDTTRLQLHIRLRRDLPADPGAAFIRVGGWTRNLEARIAGSGVVGDNLAARLDGVRTDALYARVLFLFLGLPGVLLAAILTLAIAATGAERRQQEQALLRVRGATTTQILRLAALEGLVMGALGVIPGVGLGWLAVRLISPVSNLDWRTAFFWIGGAGLGGFLLSVIATLHPAWVQARQTSIAAARQIIGKENGPIWQNLYLDYILLVIAAAMFWRTAGIGYELVLAPEGVAQVSVTYEAFIAPLCLWIGSALLAMRVGKFYLTHGGRSFTVFFRSLAGNLTAIVFSALGRQKRRLAQGIALVALAVAFAFSTAIFNTTYDSQARVDAELTNGADVLVQGSSLAPAGDTLAELRALPGVTAAEPLQHRFAYVGADLQDLYGIDPARIGNVTQLANAYFANHDAQASLASLAARPDAILVSEETRNDFQLALGDRLNLRVQNARDNQYHLVPFTFVGVVREFPTAPKDSFLVANASYIAQQTGSGTAEIVLLKTDRPPESVEASTRDIVSSLPGVKVTDIGAAQKNIGSSLTAVNLRGLTTLELSFAVLLSASASGLILALGLAERKKTFAALIVQGAKPKHLGAFVWSEGLTILAGGAILGSLTGLVLAELLVKMLTHIFDPPPESLVMPWGYLIFLLIALLLATIIAVFSAIAATRRSSIAIFRSL